MKFLPKGLTMTVEPDRVTPYVTEAIKGHAGNNEGSVNGNQYVFGPCMVEEISLEVIHKNLPASGGWMSMLADMHSPRGFRYMFLDGQQVVYVTDSSDVHGNPLLFQIGHASFRSQQGGYWRDLFPEEVWEHVREVLEEK